MGQDLTIIFIAKAESDDFFTSSVLKVCPDDDPENLALFLADEQSGPNWLRREIPEYRCLSLWSNQEIEVQLVASDLSSKTTVPVLVVMMSDHAQVGGWQIYTEGRCQTSYWADPEDCRDYSSCGIEGFQKAFGVVLSLTDEERLGLVETLAQPSRGVCLHSSSSALGAGQPLTKEQMVSIREDDVPDAEYACCLVYDA